MKPARCSMEWSRPTVVVFLAASLVLAGGGLAGRHAHGDAGPTTGAPFHPATPDARGRPALLEQLRGGTPAERRAAARRLAEIGDAAAATGLAEALHDEDEGVRTAAHDALWALWERSGNSETDALLQHGVALMQTGRYQEAVAVFGEVIAAAPGFAEGWNKRATVYYLMGEYDQSLADCEAVIRRNPIHFGALSGFGLNYLHKGNLERAAEYFERALAINPNLSSVESMSRQIRELLRQRRLQAI